MKDTNYLTQKLGLKLPVIAGPMYPCSNPELVAAVSRSGAMGVIQPVSLTYVHGYDFKEGVQKIQQAADNRPVGLNLLIETSSKMYLEKNQEWLEIALQLGVRFFITALGDPEWVVKITKPRGGVVFHDVTDPKFAKKAIQAGVDGLICVNNRAGGHAGHMTPEALVQELKGTGLPLVCAGGIGSETDFKKALSMGYSGVSMGTRFIATHECTAHDDYKQAILKAKPEDIIMTKKITGVPVSVINTEFMKKRGAETGFIADLFLKSKQTKHLARMFYTLRSLWQLKNSNSKGSSYKDYFQAGKSVGGVQKIETVAEVVGRFEGVYQKL
jgi:nitronate monooxygenase